MNIPKPVQQLALLVAAFAAPAASADYIGALRLPGAPSASSGFYSFSAVAPTSLTPGFTTDAAYRLKLGYKYSRFLTVESEYVDFGNNAGSVFANPANLSSAFRTTGFGVDTIATVPVWRQFSFYGRLGAYSGSRNIYFSNPPSLLADSTRAPVRYGLGVRYDFTKAFGIPPEPDRYSPLGSAVTGETAAALFSVCLSRR